MHPNPAFRKSSAEKNLQFAKERGFGALTVNGESMPLIAHVPFRFAHDKTSLELHLVRSNPIARVCPTELPAVFCISGPHGYVSPDWYETEDQVPTWNYVAVHLKGTLQRLPDTQILRVVDEISETFESRLEPKPAWKSAKMTPSVREKMLRMIVPFRFLIDAVEGTWKLNQNKTEQARKAASMQMGNSSVGSETAALATLMNNPGDE